MSRHVLNGGQFHQLTMFETAQDLREGKVGKFLQADLEEIHDWDESGDEVARLETPDEGWERKAVEADMMGLTEHIDLHGGVERPVDINVGSYPHARGTIMNGHHRIAGQHDVNPRALMPVQWTNRAFPGSAGRIQFPGHEPEEKRNWYPEDEEEIGYDRQAW